MDAVVRLCLALFPAPFRREFGASVRAMVRDEMGGARRRGRAATWWFAVAAVADLLRAGAAEWWRPSWHAAPRAASVRSEQTMRMIEQWWRDLRLAVRALARTPAFTAVSAGTLALAVGANTAIFAVVNAVLINPLPYAQTDRLMFVAATAPGSEFAAEFGLFDEAFLQFRDRATLVEDFAFFNSFTGTVGIGDRVERLRLSTPTYNLFATLGVAPVLGRLPGPDDHDRTALLSHTIWRDWLGSDPGVIGRTYVIDGARREIIGVMGPDFRFGNEATVAWAPRDVRLADFQPGDTGSSAVARIKSGATSGQVADELTRLARQLPERFGNNAAYARVLPRLQVAVRPLAEEILGPVTRPLGVLLAATLIVLAIACANVGNLLAVRAEGRRHELAVRQAIGARAGQLVRGQMAEILVIAAAAAGMALVVARLALPLFLSLAPTDIPRLALSTIGPRVIAFTGALAFAAALACGLVPAWRASRVRVLEMREGSRSVTGRRHWGRDTLLAGQTALALVLLVGAGLLLRSHARLSRVDGGYSTEDLFTFQIAPNQPQLVDGPTFAQFSLDFMDRLRALPGVESVGLVENVPLEEGTAGGRFLVDGAAGDSGIRLNYTFAGPDYYRTMGIDVLAGRPFTREDAIGARGHVVISKSAARLLWPDGSAVGRRIRFERFQTWETVIGVVDDVMQNNWRLPAQPVIYFPLTGQEPRQWRLPSPGYVVKSARAETIEADIRALVRQVAPEAPMYRAYTMRFLAERQMRDLSFTMLTLGVVSVLALVLGAVGLYGSLSYVVAQRTKEIGVRLALGAQPRSVRRMVVRQGGQVVGAGVVVGSVVAMLIAPMLGRLLFDVPPVDALTFGAVALSMLAIGLLASYVPARRASNVDPIIALRGD